MAFLTLGCFAWGTSFMWIKVAVEEIGPFMLVALRLTFGTFASWFLVIVFRIPPPRSLRVIGSAVVLAFTNMAIPFTLISWGETHIASGLAGVLNATTPLFAIVIAHLFLGDDQVSLPKLAGMLMGFAGIVMLFSRDIGLDGLEGTTWAQLAIIGASLGYALSGVYHKLHLGDQHPIAITAVSLTAAMLLMWVLTIIVESPLIWPRRPITWTAAAWLGVVGTALAYPLLYFLIHAWGPTRTALVTYVIPIVAVTLGVILLGEMLDSKLVLGGLLVIGGISIVNWRQ